MSKICERFAQERCIGGKQYCVSPYDNEWKVECFCGGNPNKCEYKEYRQSLTIHEKVAIEKSIPMPPKNKGHLGDVDKYTYGYCGRCGNGVNYEMNYCDMCGQAIDWSLNDEK